MPILWRRHMMNNFGADEFSGPYRSSVTGLHHVARFRHLWRESGLLTCALASGALAGAAADCAFAQFHDASLATLADSAAAAHYALGHVITSF